MRIKEASLSLYRKGCKDYKKSKKKKPKKLHI